MNYTKQFFLTAFIIISALFITSCLNDFDELQSANENSILEENNSFLGKKLENPYSIENMKKALENIKGNFNNKSTISTTHYYIRYLPANEEELDLIKSDTLVEWYSYPLDYEINENSEETSYHDPSIPENQPTWQYTAIPVYHPIFEEVEYEILEELYIPEKLDDKKLDDTFINAIVDEALRITNNLPNTSTNDINKRRPEWIPAGNILVWDDIIGTTTTTTAVFDHWECYDCDTGVIVSCDSFGGPLPIEREIDPDDEVCRRAVYTYVTTTVNGSNIPLRGAKVRARRWFTTHRGITDSNGDYTCDGDFRGSANYSIIWERAHYDIRNGLWPQAYYNGPNKIGDWNLKITGGKSLRYATIHRAANRYYYENVGNLFRPYTIFGGQPKMKISYYHRTQTGGSNGDFNPLFGGGIFSHIRIFGENNSGWRSTEGIFSTTAHEMSHASHSIYMGNIQFIQVADIISESWAEACERQICEIEYIQGLGFTDYEHHEFDRYERWVLPCNGCTSEQEEHREKYTPLFIDLIDDINQHDFANNRPDDSITGYSLSGIQQNILFDSYGLSSFRDNILNYRPSGVTTNQLNTYINYYFNNL